MAFVVNNMQRAVLVGGVLLIPGKRAEFEDIEGVKAMYPRFAEMLTSGELSVVERPHVQEPVPGAGDTPANNEPAPMAGETPAPPVTQEPAAKKAAKGKGLAGAALETK